MHSSHPIPSSSSSTATEEKKQISKWNYSWHWPLAIAQWIYSLPICNQIHSSLNKQQIYELIQPTGWNGISISMDKCFWYFSGLRLPLLQRDRHFFWHFFFGCAVDGITITTHSHLSKNTINDISVGGKMETIDYTSKSPRKSIEHQHHTYGVRNGNLSAFQMFSQHTHTPEPKLYRLSAFGVDREERDRKRENNLRVTTRQPNDQMKQTQWNLCCCKSRLGRFCFAYRAVYLQWHPHIHSHI